MIFSMISGDASRWGANPSGRHTIKPKATRLGHLAYVDPDRRIPAMGNDPRMGQGFPRALGAGVGLAVDGVQTADGNADECDYDEMAPPHSQGLVD